MKRVFTDQRFPGHEVVIDEGTVFQIFEQGQPVSSFESWDRPDGTISDTAASRRAADYFERLAQSQRIPLDEVGRTEAGQKPGVSEVDRLISAAQRETPERQTAMRRHIVNMMRQEERLAEAVVSHLIEAT